MGQFLWRLTCQSLTLKVVTEGSFGVLFFKLYSSEYVILSVPKHWLPAFETITFGFVFADVEVVCVTLCAAYSTLKKYNWEHPMLHGVQH